MSLPSPLRDTWRRSGAMPSRLLVLLASVTLLGAMLADGAGGDDADAVQVTVTPVAGETVTGLMQQLGQTLEILLPDGQTQRQLDRRTLLSIAPVDPSGPAESHGALALLVNGDVLCGTPVSVDADALELAWTGTEPATKLQVPLEYVRSIVFAQPRDETQRHRLQRLWALEADRQTDRLLLLNGTFADGEFESASVDQIELKTSLGPVNTPLEEVAAITMNPGLATEVSSPEQYAVLLSTDGSRVTLHHEQVPSATHLSAQTIWGQELEIPVRRIQRLQLYSGQVQSLTDWTPDEYVFTPYFTERHPLVTNRNVHGGPLLLRGARFASGLGMHSRSQVTYRLKDAGVREFRAKIGIDDMAGGQGHVLFAVAVDGQRVFESPGVTGRDEALSVGPIDLTGAAELTLSVDFGRVGNIRDIADWCDPLLIK